MSRDSADHAINCARENAAYLRESLALYPELEEGFKAHSPEDLIQKEYAHRAG